MEDLATRFTQPRRQLRPAETGPPRSDSTVAHPLLWTTSKSRSRRRHGTSLSPDCERVLTVARDAPLGRAAEASRDRCSLTERGASTKSESLAISTPATHCRNRVRWDRHDHSRLNDSAAAIVSERGARGLEVFEELFVDEPGRREAGRDLQSAEIRDNLQKGGHLPGRPDDERVAGGHVQRLDAVRGWVNEGARASVEIRVPIRERPVRSTKRRPSRGSQISLVRRRARVRLGAVRSLHRRPARVLDRAHYR